MVMARQRDRVDVNRAVGEHIGIGSNWKVCYRFGAGQNTRTLIGDGGGVSGGGSYRESRGRVVCRRGRLVRWLRPRGGASWVRCRARRRRRRRWSICRGALRKTLADEIGSRSSRALAIKAFFALLSYPYR